MGISSSRIKLSQLRALVAVARCGSFGEAALDLGLTQPTISHSIATLEAELGVVLMIRGRSGAVLTPAGEDILTSAATILELLETMEQQANRHRGLEGGRVRVASFRSAAAILLPEVVAQFRREHAGVEVIIQEHYDCRFVEQALRDGQADIGLTFLPTAAEFEATELLRDPYLLLLPPDAQVSDSLPWEELVQLPLIAYPDDNSCFLDVQRYFQRFGHAFQPRYQFRETSTILNMVAQGLGAAILPTLSAMAPPPGVQVRPLQKPLERTVGAITLAEALQPPGVFTFLQRLQRLQRTRWPLPLPSA